MRGVVGISWDFSKGRLCVCVGGGGREVTMCHTHRCYHVAEEIFN